MYVSITHAVLRWQRVGPGNWEVGYWKHTGRDGKYPEVKPLAVYVMEEAGVDMSGHHPKLLSDIPAEVDILITMGCNVECPNVPCQHREDWLAIRRVDQ